MSFLLHFGPKLNAYYFPFLDKVEEAKKKIKVEDEENRMSVEDIAIGLPATDGNQTTDRAETHGPEPATTRNLV